ncbi:MAG: sodium/proton-translocating pyrophosphatase, partial [Phycisphaerales bacterium]|nr:sodium/proton-translocating pyrophosphatase [Phycisphaerales bacterium]
AGGAADLSRRRLLEISGEVPHGDHSHRYDQIVISARNADLQDILVFYNVTLTNPRVLGGLFVGVLLTFLFCALTMSAVGRAASAMMVECRRQFAQVREALRRSGMSEDRIARPENWPASVEIDGHRYPDYARCVGISTAGSLREMILPASLAVVVPVAVGLTMSVPGVMGLLAGGLVSGFAVAVFMANAGGAWDNAKKLIEASGTITAEQFLADAGAAARVPEEFRADIGARAEEALRAGRPGELVFGKGSDCHKAAVVGDTVGDPFKDTSGPSLNILIKLLSSVAVVFAALTVKFGPIVGAWIGLG